MLNLIPIFAVLSVFGVNAYNIDCKSLTVQNTYCTWEKCFIAKSDASQETKDYVKFIYTFVNNIHDTDKCKLSLLSMLVKTKSKWDNNRKFIQIHQIDAMCLLYKNMVYMGYGILRSHFTVFGLLELPHIIRIIDPNSIFENIKSDIRIESRHDAWYIKNSIGVFKYYDMNLDVWISELY
jgi:hypothetical protein